MCTAVCKKNYIWCNLNQVCWWNHSAAGTQWNYQFSAGYHIAFSVKEIAAIHLGSLRVITECYCQQLQNCWSEHVNCLGKINFLQCERHLEPQIISFLCICSLNVCKLKPSKLPNRITYMDYIEFVISYSKFYWCQLRTSVPWYRELSHTVWLLKFSKNSCMVIESMHSIAMKYFTRHLGSKGRIKRRQDKISNIRQGIR